MDFTSSTISIELEQNEDFIVKNTGKLLKGSNLKRIRSIGIPKVYKTIWLSKDANSNIQAIALDNKNRKQYYYSKSWCDDRKSKKYDKFKNLYTAVTEIRKKSDIDKRKKGFPKVKTMAYMLRIIELTNIRVGNKKYLDKYNSYGLTTLKKEHLTLHQNKAILNFNGKHNVQQKITINDRSIVKFLKNMYELPEEWLMKYSNDDKIYYRVSAQDLNNYLHEIVSKLNLGFDFSCKDYRTFGANLIFIEKLKEFALPKNDKELNKNISEAIESVCKILGNNKAVSKSSYIIEDIIEKYKEFPDSFLTKIY